MKMVMAAVLLAAVLVAGIIALTSCTDREKSEEAATTQDSGMDWQQTEGTTEQLTEGTEPKRQLTERDVYGCELYGVYEYPWSMMSQDWGCDDVEGFYYHEISEECRAAGGSFPVIAQVYTYIVCKNAGVDYEVVFALIEKESSCVWAAKGDGGSSIGLMQVSEKWHSERMERLGCNDLTNPYQNIMVGVDFLAELQDTISDTPCPMADVLAAYNYGLSGAKKHLWANDIHWYSYNEEIMARAQELKAETAEAMERLKAKEEER